MLKKQATMMANWFRFSEEAPLSFLNLLLLFHALNLSLVVGVAEGKKFRESLYEPEDQILELKSKTFDSAIYNKRKAFFIEFYSSWCGGCIAYAPTYKKFAKEVARWRPIVEVASLNCASDENAELCREHEIDKFPTVKYFKYGSRNVKDGKEFAGEKYDTEKLAMNVAHLVAEDYRTQKPAEWPMFELIGSDVTLPKLWREKAKFLAVVINQEVDHMSAFAAESVLDWNGIDDVQVVSAKPSHPIIDSHFHTYPNAKNTPGVVIFKKGDPSPIFTSREALTRESLNNAISDYGHLPPLSVHPVPSDPDAPPLEKPAAESTSKPETLKQVSIPENPHIVHMEDILSGLSYMLRHEVALKKTFTLEQTRAITKFVDLLNKYFPSHAPVRRLLHRLYAWLSSRDEGSSLTGEIWSKQIDLLQDELGRPLPQNVTWVSCQGSEPKYRGYPCSLWTIFHLLTTQAFKTDGQDKAFKSVDILETIHGYIANFFGCAECVKNFGGAAKKIPSEAKRPEDAVLWLWKSHNRANHFLQGGLSVDPKFPKQQFPNKALCPTCQKNTGSDGGINWNEWEVLAFLLRFYAKENIKVLDKSVPYHVVSFEDGKADRAEKALNVNPRFRGVGESVARQEREELEAAAMRKANKGGGYAAEISSAEAGFWNFTRVDFSLCLTLWLGSVVIVGSLFLLFRYRKHRHRYWKQFEHRVS